jgi:hypothetical protein
MRASSSFRRRTTTTAAAARSGLPAVAIAFSPTTIHAHAAMRALRYPPQLLFRVQTIAVAAAP